MDVLRDLGRELRFAWRRVMRQLGAAAAATAALAPGIGIAVAMFAIGDSVLRQPLPVQDQDRIVVLTGGAEGSIRRFPLTYEHFRRFREEARTLVTVAGTVSAGGSPHAIRDGDRVLSLNLGLVTGNFFEALGVTPSLGRLLAPDDDVAGAAPVAAISYELWRGGFDGDPDVIGRRVTLHQRDRTYTIVGVAPRGLDYPTATDVWVPLEPLGPGEVIPLGRLVDEATPAHAAAELRESFRRQGSRVREDLKASARTLTDVVLGDVRPALLLLSAAAALLLVIACVNVANLMLVRAAGRTHDIAVRRALGAGRARLFREMLAEACLIILASGLTGAMLAIAILRTLVAFSPPELPRIDEVVHAGVPFGIAIEVTLIAILICGVAPALWIARRPTAALAGGDRTSTTGRAARRVQHALVAFQVALAVVVLAAAGLIGRSLLELERQNVGFDPGSLSVVHLAWPQEAFDRPEEVLAIYDRLIPQLEALPDVVAAAPVNIRPFTGAGVGWDGWFVPEGGPSPERHAMPAFNMAAVGHGYFRALDLPLLRGRGFSEADREGSALVVVLSDGAARVLWPGEDPVGRRLSLGSPRGPDDWRTVVGVVPETRYRALRDVTPTVYLPYRQMGGAIRLMTSLAVRTAGAGVPLSSIRHVVHDTDPTLAVMATDRIETLLAQQLARPRLNAILLGVFGAGALLLAGIGLYAVLAFVVRQRTRELAIRHALGASPSRLRGLVLRQALLVAALGVAAGLGCALAGGRLLQSLLYQVSPSDPATLAGAAAALLFVAVLAAYLPSRRAMRTDTVAVLHEQ